jgi:hypothetical protein
MAMQDSESNYRGYVIINSASGPTGGPWIGNYSVWELKDGGEYREELRGFVHGVFTDQDSARSAAAQKAKEELDDLHQSKIN